MSSYEGRPTDEQVARAEVLRRQLDDVVTEFNQLAAARLPAINQQLKTRKLKPMEVISEPEWQKSTASAESPTSGTPAQVLRVERD